MNAHLRPVLPLSNVMSDIREVYLKRFPGSLRSASWKMDPRYRRLIRNAVSELLRDSSSVSECISSIDLLCEYEKSALFLLILLLPGDLSKWTFFFVSQRACFMNVLQWTVFVSLLGKRNCRRISKSKWRPRPPELLRSQLDMALTSMYTKVLTEREETKCSNKCWQRNMSQHSLLSVIISFVFIIYLPVVLFQCLLEKSKKVPLLQVGFAWLGSSVSLSGFLMQTLHRLITTMLNTAGSRLMLDLGRLDVWAGGEVTEGIVCECFVTRINTQPLSVLQPLTLFF